MNRVLLVPIFLDLLLLPLPNLAVAITKATQIDRAPPTIMKGSFSRLDAMRPSPRLFIPSSLAPTSSGEKISRRSDTSIRSEGEQVLGRVLYGGFEPIVFPSLSVDGDVVALHHQGQIREQAPQKVPIQLQSIYLQGLQHGARSVPLFNRDHTDLAEDTEDDAKTGSGSVFRTEGVYVGNEQGDYDKERGYGSNYGGVASSSTRNREISQNVNNKRKQLTHKEEKVNSKNNEKKDIENNEKKDKQNNNNNKESKYNDSKEYKYIVSEDTKYNENKENNNNEKNENKKIDNRNNQESENKEYYYKNNEKRENINNDKPRKSASDRLVRRVESSQSPRGKLRGNRRKRVRKVLRANTKNNENEKIKAKRVTERAPLIVYPSTEPSFLEEDRSQLRPPTKSSETETNHDALKKKLRTILSDEHKRYRESLSTFNRGFKASNKRRSTTTTTTTSTTTTRSTIGSTTRSTIRTTARATITTIRTARVPFTSALTTPSSAPLAGLTTFPPFATSRPRWTAMTTRSPPASGSGEPALQLDSWPPLTQAELRHKFHSSRPELTVPTVFSFLPNRREFRQPRTLTVPRPASIRVERGLAKAAWKRSNKNERFH